MASTKFKSGQIDESKFEDAKYMEKLKVWSERVGLTIEEIKEKKITKNQLKKMFKQQVFKSIQGDLRKKQREKRKLKKRELIKRNEYTPVIFTKMDSSSNKMKIAIDLSFDGLMEDRELQKAFKQIQRCYSANRRSKEPCQFYLTSFTGRIKEFLLSKSETVERWDIKLVEEHWYDHFKSTDELSNVIFLTPDSESTLPDAEQLYSKRDDYIFIIGGIVDHNFHKNLTLNVANEKSVQSAKLPIDEYIKMASSKVLSINHVFEIMLAISTGTSWSDSLNENVPLRKMANKNVQNNKDTVDQQADVQTSNSLDNQIVSEQPNEQAEV